MFDFVACRSGLAGYPQQDRILFVRFSLQLLENLSSHMRPAQFLGRSVSDIFSGKSQVSANATQEWRGPHCFSPYLFVQHWQTGRVLSCKFSLFHILSFSPSLFFFIFFYLFFFYFLRLITDNFLPCRWLTFFCLRPTQAKCSRMKKLPMSRSCCQTFGKTASSFLGVQSCGLRWYPSPSISLFTSGECTTEGKHGAKKTAGHSWWITVITVISCHIEKLSSFENLGLEVRGRPCLGLYKKKKRHIYSIKGNGGGWINREPFV